jgi:hypothetical protein
MESKQERMIGLMREILQENFLEVNVQSYHISESLNEDTCRITSKIGLADGAELVVEGEGVGMIDAFFNGIKLRLADEYPSLKSITFSQFLIKGLMEAGGERNGTDAQAEARVGILNSEGQEFLFKCTAPSVTRAGLQATAEAAAYFVNSERTFVKLHDIIEHYRRDGRMDLVEKYTDLTARVVENTSYSDVVERIRKSM